VVMIALGGFVAGVVVGRWLGQVSFSLSGCLGYLGVGRLLPPSAASMLSTVSLSRDHRPSW
jgi:hypothetical protein